MNVNRLQAQYTHTHKNSIIYLKNAFYLDVNDISAATDLCVPFPGNGNRPSEGSHRRKTQRVNDTSDVDDDAHQTTKRKWNGFNYHNGI